jgi:hypothetical protein
MLGWSEIQMIGCTAWVTSGQLSYSTIAVLSNIMVQRMSMQLWWYCQFSPLGAIHMWVYSGCMHASECSARYSHSLRAICCR